MAGIVLKDICKVYPSRDKKQAEGVLAVNNFNMEIEDNEFIVFVGPSGCGKSTTLRMIAGLEGISSGELYIDGQYMNDTEPKNRDISMVFQNYALYPHMTAYKNIAFGLTTRKIPVPVYEENEHTKDKIAEIANLQADTKAVFKGILSAEKELAPLEKKLATKQQYLDNLSEEIEGLQAKKAKTVKMRQRLDKLQSVKKELEETVTGLRGKIREIEDKIMNSKEKMEGNDNRIAEIREMLSEYQKKAIDKEAIQKAEKDIAYYEKAAIKDEKRRKQDEEALKTKEAELEIVEKQMADCDKASKLYFQLEMKLEELQSEISFLKEELRILDVRKVSLERELQVNKDKMELYKTTEQPVFHYRHYTDDEIDRKVKMAADILDINKLLNRKPREMSGGQRQRIALGRAIVREPKVFLLDEPLSNLDAKLRATMRTEITRLHKKLKTKFIYVTHDQVEAMTMGSRIVVMKDGVIQQIDTPTNLFDYPDNVFVAGFIGTPQMNFFKIRMCVENGIMKAVFADGTEMSFDTATMREIHEAYCDGNTYECVLGVRGEHIDIVENGLPVQIGLVEILGSETHLHVHMENEEKEIIVNLRDRGNFKAEDQIYLNFNEGKIHLFDAKTTQSIMSREMRK